MGIYVAEQVDKSDWTNVMHCTRFMARIIKRDLSYEDSPVKWRDEEFDIVVLQAYEVLMALQANWQKAVHEEEIVQ